MNNSKSIICWLILRIFYPFMLSFKAITGKKKICHFIESSLNIGASQGRNKLRSELFLANPAKKWIKAFLFLGFCDHAIVNEQEARDDDITIFMVH